MDDNLTYGHVTPIHGSNFLTTSLRSFFYFSFIFSILPHNINVYSIGDIMLKTDLKTLQNIRKEFGKHIKQNKFYWCSGGVCACMGCVNMCFTSKQEYTDYKTWTQAGFPNHTNL